VTPGDYFIKLFFSVIYKTILLPNFECKLVLYVITTFKQVNKNGLYSTSDGHRPVIIRLRLGWLLRASAFWSAHYN